jgi:fido (protein-threonine AMPylation protein)
VESWKIQPELYQTIQDVAYWIENKTYAPDEIAVRFHHRLVLVHPFPNGNGRWSRLAADLLIVKLGSSRFSWGCSNLQAIRCGEKAIYRRASCADAYDLSPLVLCARS